MQTRQGNVPNYLVTMLLIMGAFGVMGGGMVAPALPTIGRAFDVPEAQQGLVLSVYTLAAAISLPFIGYFIDAIGRRRVALGCLLIDATAGVAIALAPSYIFVLVLRFFQGIGIAGLIPVAMTIIGDLFTGDRRLQVMGYLTGVISLGAAVIPTLGGALASVDWRLVFLAYGLGFFFAIFFFITLPETKPVTSEVSQSALDYIKSLFSVLTDVQIRNLMLQPLMIYFFLYALVTFYPIFLTSIHGFAEIINGLALSLQGLFSAIIAARADLFARYLEWWQRVSLGFILKGISFALLPFWPEGSYLISISVVLYGVGFGIVSPTVYNRATKLPPEHLVGSVVAIFNTMRFLGMTLSPFILGIILSLIGINSMFFIVAAASIIWGILMLVR